MTKRKKISIIIPIFNTEQFLETCVNSVLQQTYTNFELILVDDGSTDTSGSICDAYAKTDPRINVLHTPNSGVSAARNLGIKQMSGEFVMFVDSDDSLEVDVVEFLYDSIDKNGCDVATCALQRHDGRYERIKDTAANTEMVVSGEDALRDMLYQRNIVNMPGAKLYRSSLFADIQFSESIKIGEDIDINYKIFLKAHKIVINSAKKYYYLKRSGSAMHSTFSDKHLHALDVLQSIRDEAAKNHPSIERAVKSRLFNEASYVATAIPYSSKKYRHQFIMCLRLMRTLGPDLLRDNQMKTKYKFQAFVSLFSPALLIAFFKFKRKIKNI